jgi:fucose permease
MYFISKLIIFELGIYTHVDKHIYMQKSGLLIVMLWVGISVGRVVGIFDQIGLKIEKLYLHLYIQLWGGALSMAAVIIFPKSAIALWVGVISYGVFNGPAIGYVYDLCNRTTAASEKGMSIVMFGLNVGASVVPYLVSKVWESGGGPMTLPIIIVLSHVLPIPCQYAIRILTKVPAVVTWSLAREVLFGRIPESGSNLEDDEQESLLKKEPI